MDEEHALALFSDPESARSALQQPCKYQKRPFAKVCSVSRPLLLCASLMRTVLQDSLHLLQFDGQVAWQQSQQILLTCQPLTGEHRTAMQLASLAPQPTTCAN